jgi:hypothetical protein
MQTQYTPAPWRMAGGTIYTTGTQGRDWTIPVPLNGANRALVEAAPELVEALAWALEQIEDDLDLDHRAALEHARAVLARARGERQVA